VTGLFERRVECHDPDSRRDSRQNRPQKPRRTTWAFSLLAALLAQFGIGMYVNLFTKIPLNHPGHGVHNYVTGSYESVVWAETSQHAPLILATHAGLGLLLVASSTWLAALAIRRRRPAVTWAAVPGALCIIGAAFNGASFLDYNKNVNSYLMALRTRLSDSPAADQRRSHHRAGRLPEQPSTGVGCLETVLDALGTRMDNDGTSLLVIALDSAAHQ